MSDARREQLLRIVIAVGLVSGVLLSPALWLARRDYPTAPLIDGFGPAGAPWDLLLLLLFLGAAVAAALPRWGKVAAAIAVFAYGLLALSDQSRLQPWAFQYALMLLGVASAVTPQGALNASRLVVIAVYFWSGVHKLNLPFFKIFEWLVGPILAVLPAGLHAAFVKTAAAVPFLEIAFGVGLFVPRWRKYAIKGIIAMHLFLLAMLGPWALHWNSVVWPWNVAMISLVLLLFRGWTEPFPWRLPEAPHWQRVPLYFFLAVLPPLSLFGWWDTYPSFALYSGTPVYGSVLFSSGAAGRLDATTLKRLRPDGELYRLSFEEWAFDELNTPAYPSVRVLKTIARRYCSLATADGSLALELYRSGTWAYQPGWTKMISERELCDRRPAELR